MTLEAVLVVAAALFAVGLYGALSQQVVVMVMMGLELMINGVLLAAAGFWWFLAPDPSGQVLLLVILAAMTVEMAMGFAVATLDWRGQGLSDRPLEDPLLGHVENFATYESDLQIFLDDFVAPPVHYRAQHVQRKAPRLLGLDLRRHGQFLLGRAYVDDHRAIVFEGLFECFVEGGRGGDLDTANAERFGEFGVVDLWQIGGGIMLPFTVMVLLI